MAWAVAHAGRMHLVGGATGESFDARRSVDWHLVYDPVTDHWKAYAPMPTPRHGLGAAAMGDFIYVAGGGPVMGGSVQSAVHEAFTLA